MLAVFIEGGGADAAQFAAGQHRFEQVAGIHGAAAGTGPHHGVDLIDEQHDLALAGGDLLEHGLEPLLEFTPVFGAGNQGAHIQGNQLAVLQGRGHVAIDDPLGQALHDRRFADAWLANQDRVVLGAAREDLDRAANFLIAANHRIELALAGGSREIAAIFFQRLVAAFRVLACDLLTATHRLNRRLQGFGIAARLAEQLATTAAIGRQGQQ